MKLSLVVNYVVPSLNVTKRQHWANQRKEKMAAFRALLSALRATASGRWTLTTSQEDAKTCSTAADTLDLYLATNRGASSSKLNK